MTFIEEFIQSGILEIYIMGAASPEEAETVERMVATYPEIRQELDTIAQTMEAYAQAHAVEPKATIKPLVLATINYIERLKQGESVTVPPMLSANSRITDYADWLNRPDMVLPTGAEGLYVKIISATPAATTAIVWLTGDLDNEVHHHEYERFLVIEGTCDITAGADIYHLNPGDYYNVPLHLKHKVKVTSAIPCKAILQRVAA